MNSLDMKINISPNSISAFYENNEFFNGLDNELIERLKKITVKEKHKQKEYVNFDCDCLYIIELGHLMLFRETYDGNMYIQNIQGKGGIIGLERFFQNSNHPFESLIQCLDDVSVWRIQIKEIITDLKKQSSFLLKANESLIRQKLFKDIELEHQIFLTAPQRLSCFLLRLWLCKNKPESLDLPLNKNVLAMKLSMNAETFSRALAKLIVDKEISVENNKIVLINMKQMVTESCSACSFSFPCYDLLDKSTIY